MSLETGTRLGRYEILAPLGAGGMGEVYRARDTELERDVAIKVLPEGVSQNPDRLARFEIEARAVAKLTHPNILNIYDYRGEGLPFMVTELLDGETLRDALAGRKLGWRKAAEIAAAVAQGLAAAHQAGVVHRDLKPSNLFLTRNGQVKILDFGLAVSPRLPDVDQNSPTESVQFDSERLVGTLGYMSPEQVQGKAVDARSDIFALGCVLYEMVTGARAFVRDTAAETMTAILKEEPDDILAAGAALPHELASAVRRCLEKLPESRFQNASDLAYSLQTISSASASSLSRRTIQFSKKRKPYRRAAAAVVVSVVGLAVAWVTLRPSRKPAVEIPVTYRQLTFGGSVAKFALSQDGKWIAYSGTSQGGEWGVWVQDLTGGQPIKVSEPAYARGPLQWSPTGSHLLLQGLTSGGQRRHLIVPRLGGAPRTRAGLPHMDWSPDGTRLVAAENASSDYFSDIYVSDISGADRTSFDLAVEHDFFLGGIDWSPSDLILILTFSSDYSNYTLWTVHPDGTEQQRVVEDVHRISSPQWSSAADAVYYLQDRGGDRLDLMKVRVNPRTGTARGDPLSVVSGFDGHSISISGSRLLYARNEYDSDLWLVERDDSREPDGLRQIPLTSGKQSDTYASISPDGTTVVFCREVGGGATNIFTVPVDGGTPEQLTFFDGKTFSPAWSPEGNAIAFTADDGGARRVWYISASGGTPRVFENSLASGYLTWTPGSKILYQRPGNRNYHFLDPRTGEENPLVTDESVGWMFNAHYSPDGTSVVVTWNRIGIGQNPWTISIVDGSEKRLTDRMVWPLGWSDDGQWVYVRMRGDLMRIPGGGGDPELVASVPIERATISAVSADGQRMVVTTSEDEADLWLVDNFDPGITASLDG